MTLYYNSPGFNFNDFDFLVEDDILYASYVKKIPYPKENEDARKPNRYGLAKTTDGVKWEEVGDTIMPGQAGSWEESLWAGGISKQNGEYVIYYTAVKMAERTNSCKIGKAYSKDLIHWQKDPTNPVFTFNPENPYYSNEYRLAFRDPFCFQHQNRTYILFCARDEAQPLDKQGCVGIAEEISPNQFKWLPPLYSPGQYFDGLECPAMYEINNRWYLLFGQDQKSGGPIFRYAMSDSPFGPFVEPRNNILAKDGNYISRIAKLKGKMLLYSWFRDYPDGNVRERLASPKEITFQNDGLINN
jgi:beta-fructofuranosidase